MDRPIVLPIIAITILITVISSTFQFSLWREISKIGRGNTICCCYPMLKSLKLGTQLGLF